MTVKPGPTGEFPDGKLGPDDEGAINIAVVRDAQGNVQINFGKPVAWVAMPSAHAIELARLILRHAGAKKVEVTL